MQSIDQEKDVVDKILSSKCFSGSPSSKALLKFLVQATFDNVDVKESVIGMHIFGDKYDGEKSNARIRVSVFHLRKKLEQYYKSEGLNDDVKLTIEKGQYQVTFIKNKDTIKSAIDRIKVHSIYSLVIAFLLVFLIINNKKPKVPVWQPLLQNNKETVFYIGDVFGYMGKNITGDWGWQRDYRINSEEEFLRIKENMNLTDQQVKKVDYTYVTRSEVDAIKDISRLFYKQKKDFSVRLASRIDEKDIKEQNIIYTGPIKTNNRFIHLLVEQYPQFTYKNEILYLKQTISGSYLSLNEIYQKELESISPSELAIVSKISGTYNTQQFLFFSDHDMGVRATVNYFTNKDSLKCFQDFYLKDKDDFTAIFLVNGKERIDLGMKLLDVFH